MQEIKDLAAPAIPVKPREFVEKNYDFSTVGRRVDHISYMTKSEILKIYDELVKDFDGQEDPIEPSGLKDEGLLAASVFHPQTSFDGHFKYPTIESSAASLMYAITHNHAFHNGNKRTAMVAMLVFLDRHKTCLICDEDELFKISLDLADHKIGDDIYPYSDSEIYGLTHWIQEKSKIIKVGERPLTRKKLEQILTGFGCKILDNGKVERVIRSRGLFSIPKKFVSTRALVKSSSPGHAVDMGFVKTLRRDLGLSSEHGIGSETFYDKAPFTSSDFIIKYKNLLRRLSKF